MQPLIDNARMFGQRPEEFAKLAEGQSPQVLFITRSDSRVVPALITGARPGELFELRTAGNIVPPYASEHPTSEAATIEYAVEELGVRDIVVCGHSHCGAVGALARGDDLDAVPAVRDWLTHAVQETRCSDPCIERRLTQGQLELHGWYYDVHTGTVREHCAETDTFEAL